MSTYAGSRRAIIFGKDAPYLKVHFQNPAGTFGNSAFGSGTDSSTTPSFGTAAFDWTGDGRLDIVTINSLAAGGTGLTLWQNEPPTTFSFQGSPQGSLPSAMGVRAIAVRDLNKDSSSDIVVADYNGNSVNVLLGNGGSSFRKPMGGGTIALGAGSQPTAVLVGNFVTDGRAALDLAVGTAGGRDVRIFAGQGNGVFDAPTTWLSSAGAICALIAGDLRPPAPVETV